MKENDGICNSKIEMMNRTIDLLDDVIKKFELNDFLLKSHEIISDNNKEESK